MTGTVDARRQQTHLAAALVLGTIASTWQAIRAETARKAEAEQRQIAEAARAAESEQRKIAEAERSEAERQRELAESNFKRARETVDEYFTLVSESKLFDIPGMQPLRKELLEAALRFYEKTAVERTNDPAALVDLAVTYIRVSTINHTVDRNDDALVALDRSLDVVDRLRHQFPEARDQHRRLAGAWKGLRPTQASTEMPKDLTAAFQTISRMIGTWEELCRKYDEPAFRSDLAAWYYFLGNLLASGRQPAEGAPYLEKARATLQSLSVEVPNNPEYRADLARAHEQLARNLPSIGRQEDAEAACREALSLRESLVAEFPQSPHYRTELAMSLQQYSPYLRHRDPIEAVDLGRRAKDITESLVRDPPRVEPRVNHMTA